MRKPMTPEILRNALAAALAKTQELPPPNVAEDGKRQHSPHVTLHGFTILRATDIPGVVPQQADERCFIVRKPDGREQQVVVEIDPEAVSVVEKVANDLPLGEGFWTEQAEQFLTDFLWNDGNAPANGRLTLRAVEREALEKAARKEVSK